MKDIPTSPRIIEIRHKHRIRVFKLILLFFILFILIIWGFSLLPGDRNIKIDSIAITGTHIVDQIDIENQIKKDLSGKYFYLFSKSNSFIYPHDQIYDNLLLKFPRIESLSVYLDSLKTLHVDIKERIGSYLYCGDKIPDNKEDVGENCYFVNNDGFIFDKAPYFSGDVYFKYYVELKDQNQEPLGQQVIDIEHFHKLARFIDFISSSGFKPIYIFIDKDNTNYLYLNHRIDKISPKIIFKNDDDFQLLKDNFDISIKKKEFINEINSKYDSLLYIDLRFKNKVLYKFE